MSKSTQRRGMVASFFIMAAAMVSGLLKDTSGKNVTPHGHKSHHASGMGRDTGAIFTPKRTKHKGFMRNKSSFNKNR